MSLGIDTDILVHWAMRGAPRHDAVRRTLQAELAEGDSGLGIAPQVLHEFLHVVTDARRFEHPLNMERAIRFSRDLWDAPDTLRVYPGPAVVHRALELIEQHHLGRKRILDTVLAATLESAGVDRLLTLNEADFRVFGFLTVIAP